MVNLKIKTMKTKDIPINEVEYVGRIRIEHASFDPIKDLHEVVPELSIDLRKAFLTGVIPAVQGDLGVTNSSASSQDYSSDDILDRPDDVFGQERMREYANSISEDKSSDIDKVSVPTE